MGEQFKVLVTCENPENPLMSKIYPGRAGYGVFPVSRGKERVDVPRDYHRFKKILNNTMLLRLLASQYILCKTMKGEYL